MKTYEKYLKKYSVNEQLGDSIVRTIEKKMKEVKSALGYIANLAQKVAKNTGDREVKSNIQKEIDDVYVELKDVENAVSKVLDYMFGERDL